jgi:hypothetical protein
MHKRLGAEGLELFLEYCRHANGLLLADRVVASGASETEALYVFPHLSFERMFPRNKRKKVFPSY